jgi:hypothetical protein
MTRSRGFGNAIEIFGWNFRFVGVLALTWDGRGVSRVQKLAIIGEAAALPLKLKLVHTHLCN